MPAPRRDNRGRALDIEATKTDMSASAADERMRNTDLGSKGKSAVGAPKQEPGESAQSYAARYRKYREGTAASQADRLEGRR